jgi:preprotein translocase subunit SecA
LVQIKTGEGKSVVLAIVSIIFALNGFEVNCACYSNYLSKRDFNDFQKLFNKLGVTEHIKYGTFNEIAEYKINRECNIRDSI